MPMTQTFNLDAAAAYAERHTLHALLVLQGDELVAERYAGGWDATQPHALYSGTKSFWGLVGLAAEADGLLALDEPVAATFPAWATDTLGPPVPHRGVGFGGISILRCNFVEL